MVKQLAKVELRSEELNVGCVLDERQSLGNSPAPHFGELVGLIRRRYQESSVLIYEVFCPHIKHHALIAITSSHNNNIHL